MSAKAEIADYSVATRFGGGARIRHDRRLTRPATRAEALDQIEAIYRENRWGAVERAAYAFDLGLDAKPLDDYTNNELKRILDDFEKFSMILYEE